MESATLTMGPTSMTDRVPGAHLRGTPGRGREEYVDDVAQHPQTPSSYIAFSVRKSEALESPTSQTRTQSVSALPDVWHSHLSLSSALSSITQEAASSLPGTSSVPRHSAPHVLLAQDTSPPPFTSAHSSPLTGAQRRTSHVHNTLGQRRGSDTFSFSDTRAASSLWSPMDDPKLAFRRSTLHMGDVITPVLSGSTPRRVSSQRMSWDDAVSPVDDAPSASIPPSQSSPTSPWTYPDPFSLYRPPPATWPMPERAFVIKSFTAIDVQLSVTHGVWTSTEKGNHRLNKAWIRSSQRGPIYLFFSVNGSGRFCGMAQMVSGLDYTRSSNIWAEGDRWKGLFHVHWLMLKDIPNARLRHITLLNTIERKPITQSRDTQELLPEAAVELLHIFQTHQSVSSLFAAQDNQPP